MNSFNEADWDYVITPKRKWFDLDLAGLWRYRDLLGLFIQRNLVTLYKHTVLGPMWYVLQSLFTIAIYMFIFGGLAQISTEGVPQPLFYMAGILLWNYFNDCFTSSSNVLVQFSGIFSKIYFPRLIVPMAYLVSSLGRMFVQFCLFLIIYIWCLTFNDSLSLSWSILLLPVYIVMLALFGLSWGLILTSLTYKYRDLQIIVGYAMQLFMYATPVVYPLDTIPETYRYIVSLNPLSSIFESFKYGWFGVGSIDWSGLLYSAICLSVFLFISLLLFNRVEQNYMDTV